jgi:hypothetical protein
MEDRKRRFDGQADVRHRIEAELRKVYGRLDLFEGLHVFTPHADVPDDSALRLVVLPPETCFMKEMPQTVADLVVDYLRGHGSQPRHRANRLLFVAADQSVIGRLRDATATALAWESIVEDVDEGRLNIDQTQKRQAQKEAQAAASVVPRAARECFKWLLCPAQADPKGARPEIESFALNPTTGSVAGELERVCTEHALVIDRWAPIHLRNLLREFYWRPDRPAVDAKTFWEDSQRYLYLPRLRTRQVLLAAIAAGADNRDFFGTAQGSTADRFEGFHFGDGSGAIGETVLLIEPSAAAAFAAKLAAEAATTTSSTGKTGGGTQPPIATPDGASILRDGNRLGGTGSAGGSPPTPAKRAFRGVVDISAAMAKRELNTIAEEVINLLSSDPNATVRLVLEIDAEFPAGAAEAIRRAVSENAAQLKFRTKEWE